MLQHVLVAVDDSDASANAVEFAAALADEHRARLTLLHVIPPMTSFPIDADGLTRAQRYQEFIQRAQEVLSRAAMSAHNENAEQRIESGTVPDVICEEAESLHADLVVIGGVMNQAMEPSLVGSVRERLVKECTRPVVVVESPTQA